MELEDLSEAVEWEAKRIAAAFEVKEWGVFGVEDEGVFQGADGWYSGVEPRSGIAVTWCIDEGAIRELSVYNQKEDCSLASLKLFRGYGGRFKEWRLRIERGGHELMARGLYRLGFKDENVLSQLPLLSAHEKLELRLSLPSEFWPKEWLEEESEENAAK